MVTGTSARSGDQSIITACAGAPVASSVSLARYSVWPGSAKPLLYSTVLATGLVTTAKARFASTSATAARIEAIAAGPLVGVFSRLAAWKGQHVLLEALTELPNVGCIVVGDALFGEQAYAAELKQMVIERILREIRRRTRVVGAFPDGQSALNLAAARLRHIAGTAWSTKKYLNIELLKDQQMRGAITA